MILDYRLYISVFVIGYALLMASLTVVSHDRLWRIVFPAAIVCLGSASLFGFLDWLWS